MNSNYKARFQIVGRVEKVGDVQSFASGFMKRSVIIDTGYNRPSPIEVVLFKDDCSKGDALKVGDTVNVEGMMSGRAWNGPNGVKHFNDLVVKSVMRQGGAAGAGQPQAHAPAAQPAADDIGEMPF